ncbi:VIR protein [Plasmodium vivax]|uniref:VIR protein n=1 Tax=Plasmodium vivax TaxID=5855 RepID=A0A1G4H9E6_PLAVI|nr:VIR protein [Plasmodium vivax]
MASASTTTNQWDSVLNGLTSHKIYDEFNREDKISNYSNAYCITNGTTSTNYPGFEKICKKFSVNLGNIFLNQYKENTMDYCILLKYWIYDQIKKINIESKKNMNAFVLTEKLRKLQYTIKNEESVIFECYDDYSDYLSNWEEEKALYEYFVNFKEITNSYKPDDTGKNKYTDYVEYIVGLYKKKTTKEGCCNTKSHHPCDHYFNCNPEYDPEKLLLKLKGEKAEASQKSPNRGAQATISGSDGRSANSTEDSNVNKIVLPEVPIGWNKRRHKYITKMNNVKCITNYAAKEKGYALVSCYNIGKKYPNVENIFRPTKEEEYFYSKKVEAEGGSVEGSKIRWIHYDSEASDKEISYAGLGGDKNAVSKKSKTHVGIPAYSQGYTLLSDYIKDRRNDKYGDYQPGREVAYIYSGLGRRFYPGVKIKDVPCAYIKMKDGEKTDCVKEDAIKDYEVSKNQGELNSRREESITEFSKIDSSGELEPAEESIFKTPMFRGGTFALLLVGVVLVFFIYFKFTPFGNWISRKKSKKGKLNWEVHREIEQNVQSGYRDVPHRGSTQMQSNNSPKPKKLAPPKKRIQIAYQAS